MGFQLGNFYIDETLMILGQNQNDELLYSLDQTSNASIEVSAESTDITDKNGNVVKTRYTSKTGTVNITEAFMHPAALNMASGSDVQVASSDNAITMPKIIIVDAGQTASVAGAKTGTIKVIGMYGNGANEVMADEAVTAAISDNVFTAPAQDSDGSKPVQYLVRFERDVTSGIALVNDTNTFPKAHKQTWFCAYGDPCDDDLKPCYVVLPHVVADPSVTINFDREDQSFDFNGNLNVDYCAGSVKALYYIYFPDEDLVVSGVSTINP